jgi:short-subunit dehydrogenase
MTTPTDTNKWVLIVGASSAIGRALARRFAASHVSLVLAARDIDDFNHTASDLRIRHGIEVQTIPFEATDLQHLETFWNKCLELTDGKLEGAILLQGSLPTQSDAQRDLALVHDTITINYTSPATLLTLAANHFEPLKHGFLCALSSVAGDRGRQSNYAYGSAKAALTAFMQGLRQRLSKSGVTVLTVKPGFVDTAMTWGLPGMFLVASRDRVAADIMKAIRRRRGEIYTPWFWRYIMLIIRHIPAVIFNRMRL